MPEAVDDPAAARAHLRAVDPVLGGIIDRVGPLRPLRRRGSLFAHLVRVITAQQVSTAAADSIFARVLAACGGRATPAAALAAGHDGLRAAGCSGAKADRKSTRLNSSHYS